VSEPRYTASGLDENRVGSCSTSSTAPAVVTIFWNPIDTIGPRAARSCQQAWASSAQICISGTLVLDSMTVVVASTFNPRPGAGGTPREQRIRVGRALLSTEP
jgi:hypothetical protein